MRRRESAPVDDVDELETPEVEPLDALDQDDEDGGDEQLLKTDDLSATTKIPLFRNVKVVYLGSRPHHAPTLKGKVQVEKIGDRELRTCVPRLFKNYSFRLYDAVGDPNPRRMPKAHKIVDVRDRPYEAVEHAEHVYFFALHQAPCNCNDNKCGGGYALVIGDPDTRMAVREYVARRERARKARRAFVNTTTGQN